MKPNRYPHSGDFKSIYKNLDAERLCTVDHVEFEESFFDYYGIFIPKFDMFDAIFASGCPVCLDSAC